MRGYLEAWHIAGRGIPTIVCHHDRPRSMMEDIRRDKDSQMPTPRRREELAIRRRQAGLDFQVALRLTVVALMVGGSSVQRWTR